MGIGGMSDEAVGDLGGQADRPVVDAAEPQSGAVVGERSGIEEGLQSIEAVRVGVDVESFAGRERVPCGANRGHVVAHPGNR